MNEALAFELGRLDYRFQELPLLIGGRAMAYYQLRPAGADIDFVISLDRSLFLKTLAMSEPKYELAVRLLVAKIQAIQYGKDQLYPADHFQRGQG